MSSSAASRAPAVARRPALDVVIIGAGHNGLTCACYLAAAGLKVRVVERRAVVGGAAVTEEFLPGFRNSTASYTVSLLHPRVIRDLRLTERGLRIVQRPFSNFLPLPDGRFLKFGGDAALSRTEVAKFSARDARELSTYYARLDRLANLLKRWVLAAPPNLGGPFVVQGWRDALAAARLLWHFGRLPPQGQRDLIEVFTKSAGDWLDATFEAAPLKAVLGWDAVVGNYASPYATGSAYVLLHHCIGEVNGQPGLWGHPIGGMGRITELMAQEARARGVRIDLAAPVAKVLVERGRAVGVLLENGEEIRARAVAANVNPKLLYQRLLDRSVLPQRFAEAIGRYRCGSGSFRINVALSELPDFACLPGTQPQPHHASGILFAPSLAYMDRAWRDAEDDGFAHAPIVEMLIPSVVDETLAPRGAHVASLFCQQFKPEADWDALKERAVQAIFDVVQQYCPNFRRALLGWRAWSPRDLEREFGLIGGDIFHGQLSLDQLFSLRPLFGYANYRGPLAGLYHCGSGAHPGGGVTGAPGHNAARQIVRDLA
ncbi:MAG: NAD(P)/FAD-dependent oxidoreductase [Sutterellaceae bacterium]|nr:NAD(P)/FAD-dependent oxidoreductase [Burkholderiaceae bacterium]MDW8430426.1 NAD(P)/FAD-dependent oxidoreductase [Sutterellaceae bacterium]